MMTDMELRVQWLRLGGQFKTELYWKFEFDNHICWVWSRK